MIEGSDERMNDARRREDAAIRTEQRLNDFLEAYAVETSRTRAQYERDVAEARLWRQSHTTTHNEMMAEMNLRFKPFEQFMERVNTPAKIVGAVLILMLTPVCGVLGWNVTKWLILHLEAIFKSGNP